MNTIFCKSRQHCELNMDDLEVCVDSTRFVKRHKPVNRKTKLRIVFDEDDRRYVLTMLVWNI